MSPTLVHGRMLLIAKLAVAVAWFSCPLISQAVAQRTDMPSFSNDVQPVLTRFGCNAGSCHGKLAGQNGFRLSLRGYAPEDDFKSLSEEEAGRRLNFLDPDRSLLLLKSTGQMPHGGGKLFDTNSDAFKVLSQWIASGAPGPRSEDPQVVDIAVTPSALTLALDQSTQLQVHASYSDGTKRDVTWLARFHSNDAAFATVSPMGELTAKRHGEVSAVASFQGLVDTVVLTMPFSNAINEEQYAILGNSPANRAIDQHVMAKLKLLHIPPSISCDDSTYLRRVMLDLCGTLPTTDEIREFLANTDQDKRERLVDRLLERPEFVDYWALMFGDLLQNRKERDHDVRGAKGVRAFHSWIQNQVAINRPWNEFARDVITAVGSSETNPTIGYYIVTVGEKQATESEVADSVAQAFMGTRIGCAKCHNHPLEKYTQDDYYHFISFFSQVTLERKAPNDGHTLLTLGTQHLRNLQRQLQKSQEELVKLRSDAADEKKIEEKLSSIKRQSDEVEQSRLSLPTVRQPRTGKQLSPQGLDRRPAEIAAGTDPRVRLAEWITSEDNKAFSSAIVNRLWKHFFAVGLVESVDDLRDTNPPSNQPLLDSMVRELIQSHYNLRHVMKLMVTSQTYQLASDTLTENAGDTRFYSHYYAKRLPGEVLSDAITQATGVSDVFQGYPNGTRATQLPGPQIDSYFLTTFGRSDRVTACSCERSGDVTLSQLLHLQNSETLLDKLRKDSGNLNGWLAESESIDHLLDKCFLTTLSRYPSQEERETLKVAFEAADRKEVAMDLYWAILNSKEFTFNH